MKMRTIDKKKNLTKNIIIIFSIAILGLVVGYISKSYAIYRVQKELDLIKSKIGYFKTGDYQVAVLVDGKETDTFPSYETNYKIESVDCTNGVTATFDVKNWQLNIADMSATSCKCTVSFNSKETNGIKPIAQTKSELLALNESLTDEFQLKVENSILDKTYPVGSIYMSTTDDTVAKVVNRFGGTWVKYSENTMLMGAGSSYAVNSTDGASSVKLTNNNLPSHTHTYTPGGTVSSKFTGSSSTTDSTGAHSHTLRVEWGANPNTSYSPEAGKYMQIAGNNAGAKQWTSGASNSTGAHTHKVTAAGSVSSTFSGTASSTTGCTNCNATAVNILNPYTAVYMYKRTA